MLMASDHVSSDPVLQCSTTALEHDSLTPGPQSQENVPQAAETVTTSNELDLLFSLMFNELLNGTTQVLSKSSVVTTADAPNQHQQQHTTPSTSTTVATNTPPLNIQTTPETTSQAPTQAPTVTATQNINQEETNKENTQVEEDELSTSLVHRTRRQLETNGNMCMFALTVSQTEPRNIKEAMSDSAWIEAMQDELHQFNRLDVWELVDRPLYKNVINMKWLWKKKRDEKNTVIRNKARLVAKGYNEQEGINFEELFAAVARFHYMDSNKLQWHGTMNSPTSWYLKDSQKVLLIQLCSLLKREDILLVQIYVDDIIFGSTNPKFSKAKYAQEILNKYGMTLCDSIGTPMATKHLDANLSGTPVDQTKYRSMVGALMYLTASRPDIVHATCYCARYQARPTEKHLTADTGFELTAFLDSDHAGCIDTRKSTSGGIQFLGGDKLVSWSSKKQDCTSMSLAEAEYVSLSAYCAQVLWLRTQLTDYDFHFDKIPMYCDSKAAITISCNPVQHSRTKHIDVKYHFIKEQVEKEEQTKPVIHLHPTKLNMSGSQDEIPPPPPPPPSSSQTPTQQTPHTVSTIKLPILKKGEYDIWAMKMEHYLAHTDYPIWEVIQNGNGPVSITTDTQGQIKVLPPRTAEEIVARERERKARTTLLMALPEDHLAKFHKMTDAKEMWDAIKSRFGGNDESKKMQKYILKQQFEGFSVSNSEGLHKGYDRFQSLLSQLEIHGAGVSTEDANQKFLRSLPSAWSQVSLIMRTKPGVDSLSFDDLYNNLRVFENDVKGSTASSSSTQNVAFVSENTSSTNDVSTAYSVSNPSGQNSQYEQTSSYSLLANQSSCPQLDHEDLEQLDEYDLEEMDLKWQVAMISMRMKKFYKKTGRKLQFDAKEPVVGGEMLGTLGNKGKKNGRRSGNQEDSKALVTIDREGKGPTWLFDLDYLTDSMNYQPVRSENQANNHAGPEEANHSAGTQDNIDAGDSKLEAESAQDSFVLPIWSSYSSTVKSSKASSEGEEPNKHPEPKSNDKPVDKEEQVFLDELQRLKDKNRRLMMQLKLSGRISTASPSGGAAKASGTNTVNTASKPVNTASPYGGLSFTEPTNADQDDSEIPALEEIYDNPTDGIFNHASYDDEGAVADFTNLETVMNVSPIPTSRINSIHPSTLILRDPKSTVQRRSKVTTSSGAHAFVYRNKKDERDVMVRNKARLVAQGHRQEERIDYDEVFALAPRIEAI
ncbi:retrovirus-related pol polyprotein from transposon TNT 1-94 [Tanacetum coccineum]